MKSLADIRRGHGNKLYDEVQNAVNNVFMTAIEDWTSDFWADLPDEIEEDVSDAVAQGVHAITCWIIGR